METEKTAMVPVSTLGLLMAIAMGTEWKTETNAKVVADILDGAPVAKNELLAYMIAFNALEMDARGCGEVAKMLIDGARETYGAEVLERVLKKIEEIKNVRKKRRNKK